MENKADVLIVGAGICGLYAAKELSAAGKKVIVLEAAEKAGGRIRKITGDFSEPVDAGAEFIHGDLPLTKMLLKEAGVEFYKKEGKFYHSENGQISVSNDFMEGMDRIMRKLKSLKKDIPLGEFLRTYFNDEKDRKLRESVIQLAEGFDAADSERISSFAIREEWGGDSIDESFLIKGGYTLLVEDLLEKCRRNGCSFYFAAEVNGISWVQKPVLVNCSDGRKFEAGNVLITVSTGVLSSLKGERGHIQFDPEIREKTEAIKKLGFGTVIKVNMEFRSVFWNNKNFKDKTAQLDDFGFLRAESEFSVWWTRSPGLPFLTGWIGGSRAEKLKMLSDMELRRKALTSLAVAMFTSEDFLERELVACSVSNWGTDPFTKGAYSYETPETPEAKKIFYEPLNSSVYFAGEALGSHMGTVEAAIESAKKTVARLLEARP